MSNELIKKKLFTRRVFILGACKLGLVAGLFGRMLYLQVFNNKEFFRLAENNRIKAKVIPPLRGRILDRNDQPLALNKQNHQLAFTKSEQHNEQIIYAIALKIGDILMLNPEQQADLVNKLRDLTLDDDLVISENLTWLQLEKTELSLYELPGISIMIGFSRFYPYGINCGHITGYLGTISDQEILKSSITMYPNLKIGKNGIEKTQEKLLHGVTGLKRIEVNAKGQVVREISNSKSITGQDIKLTLDINLQQKITNLLGDVTGVILVSKIDNGEILGAVSSPSFDPNIFNNGVSSTDWGDLIKNPELPLINRSVALTYPPGSGFKINAAIAALKQKFDPKTSFFCPGHYEVGDRTFHCWNKSGHGSINLYQAIAGSCNVYFWNVAKIIGMQPIADVARQMGYAQKLLNNILPGEQKGIIPDAAWKQKNIGAKWTLADTVNTTIGQGYVEATPIQILTMVSRIASGKQVVPSIIKTQGDVNFASLNLDYELEVIRKGMEMVVNSNIGTAYLNRITEEKFAMAGKTGTSQVISKRHADDDLSKANVMKKIRNHGTFVSYAPLTNPRYAFCGIIEHGGTPALAVKIAKEILTEAQLKKL